MRCSHYTNGQRCQAEATHWIRHDGEKVPGCWSCEEHAHAVLDEYEEKLPDERGRWDAVPIDWLGNQTSGKALHGMAQNVGTCG